MKCVICHGEEIHAKEVHEEIARGEDILRIPIEALVCANCGERYYDRKTIRKLEAARRRVQEETLHLREVGRVLVGEI